MAVTRVPRITAMDPRWLYRLKATVRSFHHHQNSIRLASCPLDVDRRVLLFRRRALLDQLFQSPTVDRSSLQMSPRPRSFLTTCLLRLARKLFCSSRHPHRLYPCIPSSSRCRCCSTSSCRILCTRLFLLRWTAPQWWLITRSCRFLSVARGALIVVVVLSLVATAAVVANGMMVVVGAEVEADGMMVVVGAEVEADRLEVAARLPARGELSLNKPPVNFLKMLVRKRRNNLLSSTRGPSSPFRLPNQSRCFQLPRRLCLRVRNRPLSSRVHHVVLDTRALHRAAVAGVGDLGLIEGARARAHTRR
ncbi:hypothetical protein C8F01DRAFT_340888 [Mycena amicta]|nr:hypothetical protein C8F01DRAFT_340888 [Mycena amicta]